MLTKFSVKNFKNFKDEIVFDLSKSRDYQFNKECIKDGIVNKSIIYGKNASGKTNLILGLFDIVSSITDNYSFQNEVGQNNPYQFYKNLFSSEEECIEFSYDFLFGQNVVKYTYHKLDRNIFVYEELIIDGKTVIKFDRNNENSEIEIDNEKLSINNFDNNLPDKTMSVIRYVYKNSKVKETSKIFNLFMSYVEKMLMFFSLERRGFIGFNTSRSSLIATEILERGKLKDFQSFLRDFGLNYNLVEMLDEANNRSIGVEFGAKKVLFHLICSSGTSALTLFYFWMLNISELKLVVIDEFDAFYHHKLASDIVTKLIDNGCQVILTTHNTSVMTNDLMRPDCYFRINQNGITSLADATQNEIRKAHNLEKIYRSGWFDE
ncbi:ATP-binding protein [Francisellaceae bacterium CB300]